MLIFIFAALLQAAACHPDAERHSNVGIIGGHKIGIEEVPFMASLRLNGTYHWCGGSIVHEQFILTAAHCIERNRQYKILVGTDNVAGGGELLDIEEIKMHEEYDSKTFENDICLIKLKEPLTFGPKVAKIALADGDVKLHRKIMLNVTGWGSTGVHAVSPKLRQVTVPLCRRQYCQMQYLKYKYHIKPRMLCAGTPGHDSCQGDSGGPLSLHNIQVGVTSFGLGCGELPGVYTRVASYISWIMKTINL